MSIAASLEALRRERPIIPYNQPTIKLTQLATTTSLSERAAAARNALALLSTADPTLPTFEQDLHLSDTSFDRATLPPQSQQTLQSAVTRLTLRLTPVFLTRPCNALLEWLLQTLQLPTLGSAPELDALMLCALPFHHTETFLAVSRVVLRSPNAKKWRWLVKRVKAGRLVDTVFCVEKAPVQVLKDVIARARECVTEGVAVAPLAAIVANVVARRMASDDRPILAVVCVDALVAVLGGGEAAGHFVCALFTALAAAVEYGLELPVVQTIASAAAQYLSRSDSSSATRDTSVALLALSLRRHKKCLSAKDAKMLLKGSRLSDVLSCLGPCQSVDTYREIVTCAIASRTMSDRMLRLVGIALEAEALLTAESVSKLVEVILEACTFKTGDDGEEFAEERTALLASLLTTLFKGPFSDAVDDVLQSHLAGRKVEKRERKRFRMIDAAVSNALDEIISAKMEEADGSYPVAVDILCLSHPAKQRRRKALESIAARGPFAEDANEKEMKRLVGRLTNVISSERDLHLVVAALENAVLIPIHLVSSGMIRTTLIRCSSKTAKGPGDSPQRDKMAISLLGLCEKISKENSATVHAVLLLLSFEGLLERCCQDDNGKELIKRLLARFELSHGRRNEDADADSSGLVDDVTRGVEHVILNETDHFSELLATVVYLNEKWLRKLSSLWLKRLWTRFSAAEGSEALRVVSERIRSLARLHPEVSEELISTIKENVKSVLGSSESHENAVFVWTVAAEMRSWECQQEVLTHLIDILGLGKTIDIVKDSCFDATKSDDARKRSLEWYVNFCVVHPDEDVGKEAVVAASRIAYGDASKMRIALDEIWSRRSVLNRKKREKKSILWDFLQLLSNLPERPSRVEPADVDAKLLYEMQEGTRNLPSSERVIRPPLCDTSYDSLAIDAYENHLASKLLSQEQLVEGNLYLLRALSGRCFSRRDDRGKLYSLLESALVHMGSSSDSVSQAESVYRLSMLIVSSGKPSDPGFDVQSVAKTVSSTFKAISGSADEYPNAALRTALLCLMGFIVSFSVPESFPGKDSCIELLLAHSVSSTSTGSCARHIAMSLAGRSITGDQLLHHVKNLMLQRNPKSRPRRDDVHSPLDSDDGLPAKAAVGALRAIRQWVAGNIDDCENIDLSWLQSTLTVVWKLIKAEHEDILADVESHDPKRLAAALNTLTTLHRTISKRDIVKGRNAAMEADFDALIGVAFAQEAVDAVLDPAMRDVRNAAHALVEVLVTSQESGAKHVLPKLLQSQTFLGQTSLIIKLLEHVVPGLTTQESDLREVTTVVADAAYNEISLPPRDARSKIMMTLLSNSSQSVAFAVTKECLRKIYERELRISGPTSAAKECSSFLEDAKLACDEDIGCMVYMEGDVDCRIAYVHFVNPTFLAKLGSCTDGDDRRKADLVDDRIAQLFVVLLGCSAGTERDTAIRLLLASIPLSAMQLCAREALHCEQLNLSAASLRYLGERLGTESLPLFPTWQSISGDYTINDNLRKEIEKGFLYVVGTKTCELINVQGTSPEEIQLREVATDSLKCLTRRLGTASFSVVQEFAAQIAPLSAEDSAIARSLSDEQGKSLILRGKVLQCLASFTSTLTKYSLPFVPTLLESSCSILEEFCASKLPLEPSQKNYNASVFITAAAIKALTAVLTSCPMFFGGKALRRLVLLALQTEVDAPRELLREVAASTVPVDVFVSVFGKFATVDDEHLKRAPVSGLVVLVKSVANGVDRMYKSEVKVNWRKMLNALLRTMDCARSLSVLFAEEENVGQESQSGTEEKNGTISEAQQVSEPSEVHLEHCLQLDIACAEVLVKMVLKLSESEFEAVFKALVQWLDGGSLPETAVTACEDHGAEVESNLPRALPFFAMMGRLLGMLKTIMIPYFIQIMKRLTSIISRKIPKHAPLTQGESEVKEGKSKKRRRTDMDDGRICNLLLSQQSSLRETCMKLLSSFFSLDSKESLMNMRLVGEVQEGLLSAFDDLDGQSSTVSKALQGLAKRIILGGISSDTKKNQDMLISLVREVLSRTRDPNPKLRAGALNTCKDMAVAVGDEFLATLPESMPILAEVIDDEESAVAKAAERYVLLLESVAGEPILQQLK